ncbi:MAG: ferritin family protein [Bacillota bacterium]
MMKPFRCQICGETYLGEKEADRCPFCGAAGKHLVPAVEWYPYGKAEMSPQSYEYCKRAVELELDNAAYYKASASKSETRLTSAIFKRLFKQELEHAELICEMMGIDQPELPQVESPEYDEDKFKEAHYREQRAIKFYLEIVEKASEPRVKDVFKALAEIEAEHLQMSNIYR